MQTALGGTVATTVLEGERQFELVVRFSPQFRDDVDKIRNIKVGVQTNGVIAYIPAERPGNDHPRQWRVVDLSTSTEPDQFPSKFSVPEA